jgi:hypothetical protein
VLLVEARRFVMRTRFIIPSLFLSVGALVGACVSNGPGSSGTTAALASGRVASDATTSTSTQVRAYALAPDGTTAACSPTTATDAMAHYQLAATLPVEAVALVVRDETTGRTTVLSRAALDALGGPCTMPPIDVASSVRSDVLASFVAAASGDAQTHPLIDALVSRALCTRASALTDHSAAARAIAAAAIDARTAFVTQLETDFAGSPRVDAALALDEAARAEAQLAIALDAATSDEEIAAADAAFLRAVLAAALDAGASHEHVAAAAIDATSALRASLGANTSAVCGGGCAETHELLSFAVTSAIDARLAGSNGADAVATAGATLRDQLRAAASAGASADVVAAAWATYRQAVDAWLAARLLVGASAIAALDADVLAAADVLAHAWALLEGHADAAARVAAYEAFHDVVTSAAHAALLVAGGCSQADASAALEAIVQITAATR